MKCCGCGQENKLIRAHIIPEWVYRDLKRDDDHVREVRKGVSRASRSWIGSYDRQILCRECDNYLAAYDAYGKRALLGEDHIAKPIEENGHIAGWSVAGWDPAMLEKFFLSVLWRASISTQRFFELVDLGPHEMRLRDHLWSDAFTHRNFGSVLGRFDESSVVSGLEKTIASPGRCKRVDGRNYYKLYLAGYVVMIRVDQRPALGAFAKCEMQSGKQVTVLNMPFDTSSEFQAIWDAV